MCVDAPNRDNTWAVIVTHYPEQTIGESLVRLAQQVPRFVVVDNSSAEDQRAWLRQYCAALGGQLLENEENLGIAAALNRGIAFVRQQPSARWVLLFDQDTIVFEGFLGGIGAALGDYPEPERVAVVGANYQRPNNEPRFSVDHDPLCLWKRVTYVITSGSLVSLDAISGAGDMREEFFIDAVDIEFCLRLAAYGFVVLRTNRVLMEHQVGAYEVHRFLGISSETTNHAAARHYYMARNQTIVIKEYLFRNPRYAMTMIHYRLRTLIGIALFETDRISKARYNIMGLLDGFLSRTSYSPLGQERH